MNNYALILTYWISISLISVIFTIKDKIAAKKHRQRTPEKLLMTLGFLGGAEAMYITMKIIRHKTLHKKFMIGLPIEIIFHIGIIVLIFVLTK